MQRVASALQLADDLLHTSRYFFELMQLFVRIASEGQGAVIGYVTTVNTYACGLIFNRDTISGIAGGKLKS